MANYIEKEAKTILRKSKITDSWFILKYNMNLYRGCENACAYCDGRHEKYNVAGTFGEDIEVKINALEILQKELKRIKEKSIIALGGGVGDSYQKAEEKYKLTRRTLELILQYGFPIHILTKSSLIERDIDILSEINKKSKVIISFSFSAADQGLVDIFEPGCASVERRFALLKKFKSLGFYTGIMYMPVIPFIADDNASMKNLLIKAKEANVDFIIFGGMTLKDGRQKQFFYKLIEEKYPELVGKYEEIYQYNQWGHAKDAYYIDLNKRFFTIATEFKIPLRIPHYIFKDRIELNVEIAMILFHIYYFLQMRGEEKRAYERAAWKMLYLKENIKDMISNGKLNNISGIGNVISRFIKEIVEKRNCDYYDKLLNFKI